MDAEAVGSSVALEGGGQSCAPAGHAKVGEQAEPAAAVTRTTSACLGPTFASEIKVLNEKEQLLVRWHRVERDTLTSVLIVYVIKMSLWVTDR